MGQVAFAPMIPGDDQLVPYGEDTTLFLTRTLPKEANGTTLEAVAVEKDPKTRKAAGCCQTFRCVRVTEYTLQNNSPTKAVPKLYLDHEASNEHGGFVVATKERCIKSTAAWSRFCLTLAPMETVTFRVEETGAYTTVVSDVVGLTELLDRFRGHTALTDDVRSQLEGVIRHQKLLTMLRTIESEDTTERSLHTWKQQGTLAYLDERLVEAVVATSKLLEGLAEVRQQRRARESHVARLFENQKRLRENIKSMEHIAANNALVTRYLTDLNREEDDLIKTQRMLAEDDKQLFQLQKELDYVRLAASGVAKEVREQLTAVATE
eukprot:TRINITY_DN11184_c0_g1_i1.p1 TRINITY_DN11184_c0_g1~~TRINITY_DN11184_c0_g1_i1.p1  ORF type:complete len:322 (+),score=114.11 TRINITY_DN11184_c0_g1_i1:764-1729(+)